MAKLTFRQHYMIILQKSFKKADFLLKKHLVLIQFLHSSYNTVYYFKKENNAIKIVKNQPCYNHICVCAYTYIYIYI